MQCLVSIVCSFCYEKHYHSQIKTSQNRNDCCSQSITLTEYFGIGLDFEVPKILKTKLSFEKKKLDKKRFRVLDFSGLRFEVGQDEPVLRPELRKGRPGSRVGRRRSDHQQILYSSIIYFFLFAAFLVKRYPWLLGSRSCPVNCEIPS